MRWTWTVAVALALGGCQGGETAERGGAAEEGLAVAPGQPGADPRAGLDPESRAALERSPVAPLLLPDGWNARSTVTAGRGFYAISAREGELSVYLHATDVTHHGGDGLEVPEPSLTVRGQPARILVNEGIRSVTWQRGRTSYVLEVECYRPFEDERCTGDAFLVELADRLVEVPR